MPASKTQTAGKALAQGNLDDFLNELMAPAETKPAQQANTDGDSTLYESLDPSDIYAATTLLSLIKTPSMKKCVGKINGKINIYSLIILDEFIDKADTPAKRSEIEALVDTLPKVESAFLQMAITQASGIFCKDLTDEQKVGMKSNLRESLKSNYLRNNKSSIESRLSREYNQNTELTRGVSRSGNITKAIVAGVLAIALATGIYFGAKNYTSLLEQQQQFGTYVEQQYNIELPDSFYNGLFGGK